MNNLPQNESPASDNGASGWPERAGKEGGTKDVIIGGNHYPEKTRVLEVDGTPKRARQDAFLEAYAKLGIITGKDGAAAAAGLGTAIHFEWMKEPEYAKRFRAANEVAAQGLRDEVRRRACSAHPSDLLLIFATKAHCPEYRDSSRLQVGFDPAGGGDPALGEKTLAAVDPAKLLE